MVCADEKKSLSSEGRCAKPCRRTVSSLGEDFCPAGEDRQIFVQHIRFPIAKKMRKSSRTDSAQAPVGEFNPNHFLGRLTLILTSNRGLKNLPFKPRFCVATYLYMQSEEIVEQA